MTITPVFDADEYLHLALHASSVGNHHACMTYLKELLSQEPRNAAALYLLSAQYAELGLGERAISGMKAALRIDPGLEVARFQLAVLLLDRGRQLEAKEHLTAIKGSAIVTLRTCAQAMIAASEGDLKKARERLEYCLIEKPEDQPLVMLAQRLIERLARHNGTARETAATLVTGAYGRAVP